MTQELLQGQDAYLRAARAQATDVAIFLINGVRLVGSIESFDQHTVSLRSATGLQLVYKHAISTVQPNAERIRPARNPDSSSDDASGDSDVKRPVVVSRKRRIPIAGDSGS
jgi:host factor-I protein